jgi:hypothetical protein
MSAEMSSKRFEMSPIDRWIQRGTAGFLVALAAALVGMGVALYFPVGGP